MSSTPKIEELRVVLVATRNPLNIGAAARAMSNFGFKRLRVVNPYEVAFREARSAVGAAELLASAEEYGSVAEAVADCTLVVGTTAARERAPQQAVRVLPDGAEAIRERLRVQPAALLFGSEKRGLSNEDLSHCHWILRIPTEDEQPSMNLGQAVAVCLWEIARGTGAEATGINVAELASGAEVERLTEVWFEALMESGYVQPQMAQTGRDRLREMVHRLGLRSDDAEAWLGMARQVLWKLRSGPK